MKKLIEFEGQYSVTKDGRVYSHKHNRWLKMPLSNGYPTVWVGGKLRKVHRLVAMAYIPNPKNKPFVHHRDNNRGNPHYKNLEWVTHSENIKHHFNKKGQMPHHRGEKSPMSRLSRYQVSNIAHLKGAISQRKIAKMYGVSYGAVDGIHRGANWNWWTGIKEENR